ncbi:tyrosine-type recombinase/integrase [Ectobacillus ponti]|uniref:tyrosine-type recombinase/integrase n=1 Tax=Ectobacillus ponti TaxID=2961894 RepID=UPI0034D1A1B7
MENHLHKNIYAPLLEELKSHIETYDLQSEDRLLYRLKGEPLQNKQLNRIVDRVCTEFGWDGKDVQKLTPHGFRYTIATLMHERGEEASTIQKLLGRNY